MSLHMRSEILSYLLIQIIKQIDNISMTILMEALDNIVFSREDDDSILNDI